MGIFNSTKVKITPEGGVAVQYINGTGAPTVKGSTVHLISPWTVGLTEINVPDCIGVFYEEGVPNGQKTWVVIYGIADVLFVNQATAGYLVRTFVTADGAKGQAGKAYSENVPTSPFASDKHFAEIGHIIETNSGPNQLAKCNLHMN